MRAHYDGRADVMYVRLDEKAEILDSEEVIPGVIVDFDEDSRIVGVEFIDASMHLTPGTLDRIKRVAQPFRQTQPVT
ncbi:MAG: DUF2283 domain-containing protein [Alphaproteobacteria bacterium]|jgi:uncharacterized protein YuzE|nr:DUF2283 domain-containing protein [Alphaproteobacteria bacterium]